MTGVETAALFWIVISLLAIAALGISNIKLWIEFKALQKSTHQVTYINPVEENFRKLTEDEKKILTREPFDNIM